MEGREERDRDTERYKKDNETAIHFNGYFAQKVYHSTVNSNHVDFPFSLSLHSFLSDSVNLQSIDHTWNPHSSMLVTIASAVFKETFADDDERQSGRGLRFVILL